MPVQKQRHSKFRRDRARREHVLTLKNTVTCPKCSAKILAHRVCPKCGYYKSKEFIKTISKQSAKAKKAK